MAYPSVRATTQGGVNLKLPGLLTLVLRREETSVSCYGCFTHAEMMVDSMDIEVWLTAESVRK